MADPTLEYQARALLPDLDAADVHCIRSIAFCDQLHEYRRRHYDRRTRAWANDAEIASRVSQLSLDKMLAAGVYVFDNGSTLTDLGRAVASLLALKVARG